MSEMPSWRVLKSWFLFRPWQRHSLVLMVGGLVYILIGLAFLSVDAEAIEVRKQAIVIALRMAPITLWGLVFIASGVLACLSSRWPTFSDSWGYAVLTGLSGAWAGIYILGYFLADAPISNISAGLIWGLAAFLWWAISGLRNPDRRSAVRHGPD